LFSALYPWWTCTRTEMLYESYSKHVKYDMVALNTRWLFSVLNSAENIKIYWGRSTFANIVILYKSWRWNIHHEKKPNKDKIKLSKYLTQQTKNDFCCQSYFYLMWFFYLYPK
jgi:hypothetical protein